MNVFLFQNRFEAPIVAGVKLTTIRAHRKDGRPRAKIGEEFSLRVWTGRPYASKQREIARGIMEQMEAVAVHDDGVSLGDGTLRAMWIGERNRYVILYSVAKREGFADWKEMRAHFAEHHALPFSGTLFTWRLAK